MSTEVLVSRELKKIAQSLVWESPDSVAMLPPRIHTFKAGDTLFFTEQAFLKFPHVCSSTDKAITVLKVLENRVEMQLLELDVPGSRLIVLPGNMFEKFEDARVAELLLKFRGTVKGAKYGV